MGCGHLKDRSFYPRETRIYSDTLSNYYLRFSMWKLMEVYIFSIISNIDEDVQGVPSELRPGLG